MRTVVRSAALIAFSVACGYAKLILFPYLFFVELFSVAIFLSGALVGVVWGVWVGAVSRLIFSLANPYGPPHPWILAAQVVGAGAIGAIGGMARRRLLLRGEKESGRTAPRTILLAFAAVLATVAYDLVTNLAQGVVFGSIPVALALAVLPSIQHLGSNIAIFVILGNLALPWLSRHPLVTRHAD
jgi:hypothetical protein